MPTAWSNGLRVIPAVYGEHDAVKAATMILQRWHAREPFVGIKRVNGDLDMLSGRIRLEFGRIVPDVLSPRASEWGVELMLLCPDAVVNQQGKMSLRQ